MPFYPVSPVSAIPDVQLPEAGAGMVRVAVPISALSWPVADGSDTGGRSAMVVGAAGKITSGELVAFCKVVAVAPAKMRRDERVQADGRPRDHARSGAGEVELDAACGPEAIERVAAGVHLTGKIKGKARRGFGIAFTIRATLLMTLMPDADARQVMATLLGDLLGVPWRREHAVASGTVLSRWRTAIGPAPLQQLKHQWLAAVGAEHPDGPAGIDVGGGLQVSAIDGTVTRLPDTKANRRQYGSHRATGAILDIPAEYVARSVELAYATTVHRAQGSTVDTAHALITTGTGREEFYVAATRAKLGTHLYVATHVDQFDGEDAIDQHQWDARNRSARAVLESVLTRESSEPAATTAAVRELEREASLSTLVPRHAPAHTVLTAPFYRARIREVLGERAAEVLGRDPQASAVLVQVVRQAHHDGWDPATSCPLRRRSCPPCPSTPSRPRWTPPAATSRTTPTRRVGRRSRCWPTASPAPSRTSPPPTPHPPTRPNPPQVTGSGTRVCSPTGV